MENSLELRINKLEATFKDRDSSVDLIKSHAISLIDDAGYELIENDTYHKIENDKIEIFGLEYLREERFYHATFDNLTDARDFLDLNSKINNYNFNKTSKFDVLTLGAISGATASLFYSFTTQDVSPVKTIISLGLLLGGAASTYFLLENHIPKNNYKELVEEIKEFKYEITFDFDAIKSAINGQKLLY